MHSTPPLLNDIFQEEPVPHGDTDIFFSNISCTLVFILVPFSSINVGVTMYIGDYMYCEKTSYNRFEPTFVGLK